MNLQDSFGRTFNTVRVSITDRCSMKCIYCRPGADTAGAPANDILTDDEIVRLATIFSGLGIKKIRLTGGDPLLREGLLKLVERLRPVTKGMELAMTTNAHFLTERAAALREAGLDRINISLDTLDEEKFKRIARGGSLKDVLAGIAAARAAGFPDLKINAVAMRGINDDEFPQLVAHASSVGATMRFIEFMPVGQSQSLWKDMYIPASEIIERLKSVLAPGETALPEGHGPARHLALRDGGLVGIISGVSGPFCRWCSRLRITATGSIRPCLASPTEIDLKGPMRSGATDDAVAKLITEAAYQKAAGAEYSTAGKGMCSIGG